VTEPPTSHTLNADITLIELLQALKKLQKNKATSLNGMKVEFILDAGKLLHMPLLIKFNCFLAKGFPKALSIKVVHALFKGGDASEFDNYKGITIGPILAKLFAMILDKRLNEWAEQHGLRAKGQAGFHKDYRITNQLFILRTPIEQNKTLKKPFYCYFVDFEKTFDIVSCEVLWHVLVGLEVEGRFLRCMQVMYAKDIVCINHPNEGVTSSFKCQQGVKQSCPLSPLLFGLYLGALKGCLNDKECDAPALANLHVWLLLFANDLALMSESKVGLQQQLDTLQQFFAERGLMVNMKKTKVMVFNSTDPCQKIMFENDIIECVQTFQYSGILLETTSNLDNAVEHLATTSKRSLFTLNRQCAKLCIMDIKLRCDLFNTLVHSIASYACEVRVDSKKIEVIKVVY